MHPAPSIIFFTTASGAGYGLFVALIFGAMTGLIAPERWLGAVGLGLAVALVTAGLLASTAHLEHPERAWRAVSQWRSSWLSREGLAALVTFVPALVYAVGWVVLAEAQGWWLIAAFLTIAGALSTVWCTGMIYGSLKPVREWHQPLTPWLYLAFALASGALVTHVLLLAFGVEAGWAGVLALVGTPLAFGLKALWWGQVAGLERTSTTGTATGLASWGKVRLVEPPHTQTNYLLTEMAYRVGRRHADRLRVLALALGLAVAWIGTLLALLTGGVLAILAALVAAAAGLAGIAIERWLFFAEATHTVTLYYGREAA